MLGLDVEFFVSRGNLVLPALTALREYGQRYPVRQVFKPIASDILPEGYDSLEVPLNNSTVTEDGLAIETPVTPSEDPEGLVGYMREGILASWEVARAVGGTLTATPLVHFDSKYLVDHPELRVLGCSPDRDLYGGLPSCKPPQDPREIDWRTGGGHIHMSIKDFRRPDKVSDIIFLCDMLLGTADVMLEHSDLGRQRRTMYGQPGKHRIQPHGLEYRTMSNVWAVSPDVALNVLRLAKAIHEFADLDLEINHLVENVDFGAALRAIRDCDLPVAEKVFNQTADFLAGRVAVTGNVVPQNFSRYSMEAWL